MIVAGIGCKTGAVQAEIAAAIAEAQKVYALSKPPEVIATHDDKANEKGIRDAARSLGVPIVYLTPGQLWNVAQDALTTSDRVMKLKSLPSVAETAALAAGGKGARLLGPRVIVGPVTCAIARKD